jgi:hypothetical protein
MHGTFLVRHATLAIDSHFRDICIIPSEIGEGAPAGWAIPSPRNAQGMKLAPWGRIPYNPRALNRRIILHLISESEIEKFAEEAGSR